MTLNITVDQAALLKALTAARRAVAARSTLPILCGVLLEARDGTLRVAATDLQIAIDGEIAATVAQAGAIVVPVRLFVDVMSKLPFGRVTLKADAKHMLRITAGGFKASIASMEAADYPQIETLAGRTLELDAAQLTEMVNHTAFAASRDQHREHLRCVKLTVGARLTLAATDGYRLSVRSAALDTDAPEVAALIPATSLTELVRLLGDLEPAQPVGVTVAADGRRIGFALAGTGDLARATLTAQLVDAKYPDYAAIIPRHSTTTVEVGAAVLLRALQVARLFAESHIRHCALTVDAGAGAVTVAASNKSAESSAEELAATVTGKDVAITVDIEFLADMLSRVGSATVRLEMTTANRPILLRPTNVSADEFIYVVMPISPNK